MKVALIGFGAIGTALAHAMLETEHPIIGILGRVSSFDALRKKVPAGVPVVTSANDLLALSPEIVVECAGHEALHVYGGDVLRARRTLVVSSVGALADQAIERS